MFRTKVKSSNVASLGYDSAKKMVEVEFNNGDIYQYNNVPQSQYDRIMMSESIGRAIHAVLRGKYSYRKV